jgi:hypothetical protein
MVLKPSKNLGVKFDVCILTLTYKHEHIVINIQYKREREKRPLNTRLRTAPEGNTYCLEGCEHGVGDDLSACGGGEETDGLVLLSRGAEGLLVDILEDFVETELSEALARVANESCVPPDGEALNTLSSVDSLESVGHALVESGVSL